MAGSALLRANACRPWQVTIDYQAPWLSVTLSNDALKGVTVRSGFDGSPAGPRLANSVKERMMKALAGLVDQPVRVKIKTELPGAAGAGRSAAADEAPAASTEPE